MAEYSYVIRPPYGKKPDEELFYNKAGKSESLLIDMHKLYL